MSNGIGNSLSEVEMAEMDSVKTVADKWMSTIFGCSVFKVDVFAGVDDEVIGLPAGKAFCYAKVPTTDIEKVSSLSSKGFDVVDVNVTFERRPDTVSFGIDKTVVIREVTTLDESLVKRIAEESFIYSRFHLDPKTSNETANLIKRLWIENYISGQRGERLLVACIDNKPAGFLADISIRSDDQQIRAIDLIAVDKAQQGKGIGKALLGFFVENLREKCDILRVGTQVANIPSMRLYETCGFKIAGTTYVMHGHFE